MTPAAATVKRWREDERGILQYGEEQFQFLGDQWQEKALLAFASPKPEHKRISLQACVGPGKTAVEAIAGWWFLGVQGDKLEHPQGACVAITQDNLRDNLWKEFSKWQGRSAYCSRAFTWTAKRIFCNDHPETWFLSARSWPKTANADQQGATLSGLHSKYVLCIADESGAIPTTIMRAGEQAMAQAGGGFAKFLQAGNPISLEGMLYAAANELRHLWYVIRITGDPDDPHAWVHAPRVGNEPKQWAQEQIDTYGRDNPWVKSSILGQFPPSSINALLGIEEVQAAMARHHRRDAYEWAQKRIGIDVARFGDDRTVLFPRQGLAAFKPVIMRIQNTVQIAARAAQAAVKWDPEMMFVDDTGHWGHGVLDNLQTAGYPAVPVIFSDDAIDPRYRNRRAEMWMTMAEWVKNGGAIPKIESMVAELTTPTYTFVNGKFLLEEKDQIKKRLGRSPDLADALALTFAMPDMPAKLMRRHVRSQTVKHDADPFPSDENIGSVAHDGNPFD
jgi:phage terminase large subunit